MDEHGNQIAGDFIEHVGGVHSPPEGDIYEALLAQNFIPAMATLIRRECFTTVGPYDESLAYEDWDMWLRIARHYEFAFTPGIHVRYRVHPKSLSQRLPDQRWWSTDMSIFLKHIGHSAAWDAILWDRIARAAYRLDRRSSSSTPGPTSAPAATSRRSSSTGSVVQACRIGVSHRSSTPSTGSACATPAGPAALRPQPRCSRRPRPSRPPGLPATRVCAGTSRRTTDPDATTALAPIETSGFTTAPAPTNAPRPSET